MESDTQGSYLSTFIKYQCPVPAEIDLGSELRRRAPGDPQAPYFIDLGGAMGVNQAPFIQYDTVYCENPNNTAYFAYFDMEINGQRAEFVIPDFTVPCFISGPDAGGVTNPDM